MALWIDSRVRPSEPDIYLVHVPYIPAGEAYALYDGEVWLCWATTPDRAEMVAIRGPEYGYAWRPVEWVQVV